MRGELREVEGLLEQLCVSINSKGELRINAKYSSLWQDFEGLFNPHGWWESQGCSCWSQAPGLGVSGHVLIELSKPWGDGDLGVCCSSFPRSDLGRSSHEVVKTPCQGVFTFAKWYCLVCWCQKAQLNKTSLLKSNPTPSRFQLDLLFFQSRLWLGFFWCIYVPVCPRVSSHVLPSLCLVKYRVLSQVSLPCLH